MATAQRHTAMQRIMTRKMRRKGMALGFRALVWFLCFLLLCPPQLVLAADPVPSGATNTTISTSGNGVPVVNIATPNSSGLSHNAYTSYNVDTHGLVLNNGDMSEAYRQSQLAGQIAGNPNLGTGNQASIILNEVTGTSRSSLEGFTEVLGGKADVIIANPNGITSSGGGFINTNRATLVTGSPTLTDGTLNYFTVSGGDILITGTGINASAQQMLDLVSRKVVIDGQVNAQSLNVAAGAFKWNRETGPISTVSSDYTPEWAIDSTALGGMYAGTIKLTGYGAGIGVRVQGEAAATADDFTISTSGKIEIGGKVSAKQDLAVTTSSALDNAIAISDANLSAERNLGINAVNGGAVLTGGSLVAGGDLAYNLGDLTDTASNTAGITDANKRYGNTVTLTGLNPGWLDSGKYAWNIDGVYYGAGSALNMSVYSLNVAATSQAIFNSGGTLSITSTHGDLLFGSAALKSVGDMVVQNEYGLLSFSDGAGQGVQSTNGNISLTSTGTSGVLVNKGTITADTGKVTIRASDRLDNSGSIHAGGLLDIGGWYAVTNAAKAMNINNTGSLLGGTVSMQNIYALSVTGGGKLESAGNMDVTAYSATIGGTGDTTSRILAATTGSGVASIFLTNALKNFGMLYSGYDLNVEVSNLNIQNNTTGGIAAAHDLVLKAQAGITNEGAMYAGNDLSATSGASFSNIAQNSDTIGSVSAGHDMTITAASSFTNSGYLDANHDITITAPIFTNKVTVGSRIWGATTDPVETYTGGKTYSCGTLGLSTCIDSYFTLTWTQDETFVGGVPSYSPHITGGSDGTVTVRGFDTGVNLGGTISGYAVNLIGNTGATFDNSDLMVATKTFTQSRTQTVQGSGDPVFTDGTPTSADGPAKSAKRSYIRGTTITATGLALTNTSSVLSAASPASLTATGTTFAGLTLSLPSNPNGMYVTSKDSSAGYLVETNPLYADIDSFMGSDYLLQKYNFDSDEVIKRLGDAGYETYLVGQQLATLTGTTLLPSYSSEKEQMQGLMDSAASQAKLLGLEIGTELTEYQQSLLTEDMLWMVETVVDGQTVLAPVVYLAASTKKSFASNEASISGTNVNLNVTSLTNTGGTISGSNTLNVTATGDITNNSGTLSGGDVALTSTEGSIVNRTTAVTSGDETATSTLVGSTAGIVAKGDLQLDAAKNITSLGADISAGGDASLTAGKSVVLDTVEDTTIAQTHFNGSDTTTSTTKQIGSTLSSGGNLTVTAGKDITVAGSDVSAGGSADLNAGRNVNILAREDSTEVVSTTTTSGFGVGGGLWGKETTTTDHLQTTAQGSTISSGGDVSLSADKTVTLEGASVDAKGDVAIAATDVNVLEARNTESTTVHKETTTFLSLSGGEGDSKSSSSDSSSDSSGEAEASAETTATNDAGGIDFKKTTTTDSTDDSTKAVASTISAGQNLTITGKQDVLLRGAEVTAGGDASLSGENVDITAAQDTHESTSTTTTTKVGLYASTTNSASLDATAGASANANVGSASASASATAAAGAKSSTSIDVVRTKTTEETATDITNQGTSLASGGTLTINAQKDLVVKGSDLSGETGVDLTAQDMSFQAAEDSHTSTSTTTQTSAGLYIDGTANAKAQASASANAGLGANAGVSASASGKATVSAGVQKKSSTTTDTEGSSTAQVSSITSGSGSISRTADNSITDVGTAIDAGGDFTQTAETYDSQAAANTSYKTSSTTSDVAKTGVYAKAEAGVTASAGASAGIDASAGAGVQGSASVGAGVKTSYSTDSSESASTSSQAVVSTIKTGGNITSVTSGATTLEGTQLSGGQGVALEAASLDYQAAENTETSSSSTSNVNGAVSAGLTRGTGKGFEASVSGGTSKTETTASSSTAVAGGISSGGDISIKTTGDTRLEGTNLAATGDTGIDAGGDITFDAARDTASSTETSYDASASLAVGDSAGGGGSGKSSVDAKASGGYSKDTASSSTAAAGSIASGGTLTLTSGKSVNLEGTNMASGGDATISGADGVNFSAARSTSESSSTSVRAGVTVGTSKTTNAQGSSDSKSATATAEVGYSKAKESIAEAGSLTSGGNLAINSGNDVTLEGTELGAANKASINAGGDVNFKAAESTSESTAVGVALSGSASKTDKTPSTAAQTPAARTGTGGTQGSDGSAQSNKDLATWQQNHGTVMNELKAKQASNAGTGSTNQQTQTTTPADTASTATMPTTETTESVAAGVQLRTKDQTVQQAGSITAGAGGIAINAGGGDVNLVGTNLSTSGDASVTAKDAVNITATKNTESGFGVTLAASADKKTEKPTVSTGTTGTAGTTSTPTKATSSDGTGTASQTTKTASSSGSQTGQQSGTTTKTGTTSTTTTKTASSSTPSGPQTGTAAKTGTTPSYSTAGQTISSGLSIGTTGTTGAKPATSSEWKAEAGASKTTVEDTDNTSSVFIGIGGGKTVQNEGAEISADGAVNITSGGKTTLVNTDIEAGAGENIDAAGGIVRKTETDTATLNADTNSGAAAVNEGVSSVPMYDQSGGTAPGMAPTTGVVPPVSMKNVQNGGKTPPTP